MKLISEVKTDRLIFYDIKSEEITEKMELHCHPMCEIYYFICGDVDYRIEGLGVSPTPDSMLLIPPGALHGVKIKSKKLHHRYSLHFYTDSLPEAVCGKLMQLLSTSRVFYPSLGEYRLEHFMRSILDCKDMPDDLREAALASRVTALVTQVLLIEKQAGADSKRQPKPIVQVLNYLNKNIQENITLDQLSSQFYISKNYLNTLFREATGTTVCQYVRLKRLALAEQLMHSGLNASQASIQAGFGDYSNFYRAYKNHFHVNPTAEL